MANVRQNSLFRLMPSFTDLAFLMPLVFMFTRMDGVRGLLSDGDTGWHIRAGEWMLQHGRIAREDVAAGLARQRFEARREIHRATDAREVQARLATDVAARPAGGRPG